MKRVQRKSTIITWCRAESRESTFYIQEQIVQAVNVIRVNPVTRQERNLRQLRKLQERKENSRTRWKSIKISQIQKKTSNKMALTVLESWTSTQPYHRGWGEELLLQREFMWNTLFHLSLYKFWRNAPILTVRTKNILFFSKNKFVVLNVHITVCCRQMHVKYCV